MQRLRRTVKCFYSLTNYAEYYWKLHLLDYIRLRLVDTESQDKPLASILARLGNRYVSMSGKSGLRRTAREHLQEVEQAKILCRDDDFLVMLSHLLGNTNAQDHGLFTVRGSLFGEARERLAMMVEGLMPDSVPENEFLTLQSVQEAGLNSGHLQHFRHRTSSGAYLCHVLECRQRSTGFATAEARAKHQLVHGPKFKCTHEGCPSGQMAIFRTAKDLKKHLKNCQWERNVKLPSFLTARRISGSQPYSNTSTIYISRV